MGPGSFFWTPIVNARPHGSFSTSPIKSFQHSTSSDGEELRSRILRVYLCLHGFQDLGVGLTVLHRHPDNVARPGSRRAPQRLSLWFRFLRRGHGNLFLLLLFFFFFFFSTSCYALSFCGVYLLVATAWVGDVPFFPFLVNRSSEGEGATLFSPFVNFFGISPRDAERGLRKIPIFFEAGWDFSFFWISTPLSRRHLWVLSIQLNTSADSFTLSVTCPGLFLSIPCWTILRALANTSIFLLCSLKSWRTSFHLSAPGEAPESIFPIVPKGLASDLARL